jgi:hypothetical protein
VAVQHRVSRRSDRVEVFKLGLEKIAFPVGELQVGMFVSELDRPWVETPFLFQGFLIESSDVIEKLQAHCEYVYVDVERTDHTINLPGSMTSRLGKRPQLKATPSNNSPPQVVETNSVDDTALLKADWCIMLYNIHGKCPSCNCNHR